MMFVFKICISGLLITVDICSSLWSYISQNWEFSHQHCFFYPDKRVHKGFLWCSPLKFAFQIYLSRSIFAHHLVHMMFIFKICISNICKSRSIFASHYGEIFLHIGTFLRYYCFYIFAPHYEVIFPNIGSYDIIIFFDPDGGRKLVCDFTFVEKMIDTLPLLVFIS